MPVYDEECYKEHDFSGKIIGITVQKWILNMYLLWMQEFTTNVTYDKESLYMDMFDVDFSPLSNTTFVTKTEEIFSMTGFTVEMKRSPTPYYMNVFLPTALLTITSFIGFLIPADLVPGRMALLVTIFLMLVNISSTERERGPAVSTEVQGDY